MSVIFDSMFDPIMGLEELKAPLNPGIERQCEICRGKFSVDIHSTARICPECLRRLERMLYPERED